MTVGSIIDNWLALLIGGVGALIYFCLMIGFTWARHRREQRMEVRQMNIERMTRDLWVGWLREGGKR